MVRHILVFYFKLIIQCIVLLKVLFSNIQYCCHDTLVTSKMAGWLHLSITMHKKANEQNGISADSLLSFLIWPLYCLSLWQHKHEQYNSRVNEWQHKQYNSRVNEWQHKHEQYNSRVNEWQLIKLVSDLRQVGGFLRVLRFPSPIKLTATI